MKKIFLFAGILVTTIFLAGCADKSAVNPVTTIAPAASIDSQQQAPITPPATVSIQPGATPDEEIKNIDKDLQAIDDSAFDQNALSDTSVGL